MELNTASSTSEAIRLVRHDREYLVPLIGAGISIPLGLPNWVKLVNQLLTSSTLTIEEAGLRDSTETLREIKSHLGETTFVARVQHALRLSSRVTSTALQALVTAQIPRLITTNLDYALETAFARAGVPLSPQLIGNGYAVEELALFDQRSDHPILLKIHGSLERPSTWVLTTDDYDKAYQEPGHLKEFLTTKILTPLFIGFSFSDFDIDQSLRLAKVRWKRRAYAIISEHGALQLKDKFKSYGIIPIPFYSFDQIPEIIDEIFRCSPLRVSWMRQNLSTLTHVKIGAAEIGVPVDIVDFTQEHDALKHPLVTTIANALEVQPNNSFIAPQPRRQHSPKGQYRTNILSMIQNRQEAIVQLCVWAISQYPETLFDGILPWIMAKTDLDDDDYFWFFKQLYAGIPQEQNELHVRLDAILLQNMHRIGSNYFCLRAIAKTLAQRSIHPALRLPPPTINVGALLVPLYPLTENQVEALKSAAIPGRDINH